jgi:hypothetical protein
LHLCAELPSQCSSIDQGKIFHFLRSMASSRNCTNQDEIYNCNQNEEGADLSDQKPSSSNRSANFLHGQRQCSKRAAEPGANENCSARSENAELRDPCTHRVRRPSKMELVPRPVFRAPARY